jgi:hypothetical protein
MSRRQRTEDAEFQIVADVTDVAVLHRVPRLASARRSDR